jgi:hypothetical protein
MKTGASNQPSSRAETRSRQRTIFQSLPTWATMAVTFAGLSLAGFAADNPLNPTITIQVYNYSQASPAVLNQAEREAGRILEQAGVRASWVECSVDPSSVSPQGPCQKSPPPTETRLRILATPIQKHSPDSVFGFAVHPVLASVYYEYAKLRARSDDAEFEVPTILGCVIAHELGHLLLGSNSHSSSGIMQPRWEPEQVRQLTTGKLLFTAEQSKVMRVAAQARSEHQSLMSTSSTP